MNEPEQIVRQIEAETHQYYAAHHADFHDRGYHVMYGPLVRDSPILFMGYQPGGDHRTDDHLLAAKEGVRPDVSYYASEEWPLARNMRTMFGTELLRRCTGLNAIFFRSPKIATYSHEVSPFRRRDAAAFCGERVKRTIAALSPKLVVAIGFESLRLFGPTQPALLNGRGRTLLIENFIGEIPAMGTLHLSGARIAAEDRSAMAEAIIQRAKIA